ncbi:ankyrin repeat domain-containing protein [Legionella geestiana]|uniref:ankyrin repeat domain-containing protein n=1 Tax=Legionella geestiana TaxID=45065 RepID=UPI0010919E1A|nr:ankyrin repeat domain-containing protein [Legionella geestiana]QDQ39442.1 ankyrin repeat domain-containing protein [Legionella geestiana]
MGGINISCTPLALAVKTGNTAIVKALIDANARVNGMQNFSVSGGSSGSVDIDKNTTSQTLLEVAADNNLNEIVCLLLENGAKASAHGMTANEWFDGQKRCNRSEWVNDYPENDCKAALREAERKELTLQFKRELEEYSRNRESEGKHHHFTIRLNFFGNHKFNFGQYSKKEKLMAVSDINNLLDDGLANLSRDTLMQRMNPRILGALTQGRLGEIFNKYAYMPAFNDEEIAVEHGSKL